MLSCGGCQGYGMMEQTEERDGPSAVCSVAQPSLGNPGISSSHQQPWAAFLGIPHWPWQGEGGELGDKILSWISPALRKRTKGAELSVGV